MLRMREKEGNIVQICVCCWITGKADFSQMTHMQLKKPPIVSSQDLTQGLCFSRNFSVVGLEEQLETKSSIF